jgi:hypothetical protein
MKHPGTVRCFLAMMNTTHDPIQVPGSNPNPASPNHAPVKSTTEARAGVTLGRMRWVLAVSITLVVLALIIVWALSTGS